jgi:12,18-didecarboxysiroheme deacetylase
MIGISKLYCSTVEASDPLRYGRLSKTLPARLLQFSRDKKPIVVWNSTRRCNLRCAHCYASADCRADPDELSTDEARAMIDDLAGYGAPVLLFSGGEPLMRHDLLELIPYASAAGLRTVISTNGTMIDAPLAEKLATAGLNYVGVSLDGMAATNDAFRGQQGAFQRALEGIRNCHAVGVKAGLRLTMNRRNVGEIPEVFDLIEREGIQRVCFYHLVYTGRGDDMRSDTLSHQQTRDALDLIMDRTAGLIARGHDVEVLTVDNHCDGPYVYMRLAREDPARARQTLDLLRMNGGNSTGRGIACVSWNGDVLPDQFWRHHVVGNVRARPFSEIWEDEDIPLLAHLRNRREHMHCRCMHCRWLNVCNGNFRARAEAATGDPWGDDPACYLTDEEIAGEPIERDPQ